MKCLIWQDAVSYHGSTELTGCGRCDVVSHPSFTPSTSALFPKTMWGDGADYSLWRSSRTWQLTSSELVLKGIQFYYDFTIATLRPLFPIQLHQATLSSSHQLKQSATLMQNNSMEHRPSWETNSHSASQEIPHFWRNPKVQLPWSQESATAPYFQTDGSSTHPHIPFIAHPV